MRQPIGVELALGQQHPLPKLVSRLGVVKLLGQILGGLMQLGYLSK